MPDGNPGLQEPHPLSQREAGKDAANRCRDGSLCSCDLDDDEACSVADLADLSATDSRSATYPIIN